MKHGSNNHANWKKIRWQMSGISKWRKFSLKESPFIYILGDGSTRKQAINLLIETNHPLSISVA